MKIPGLLLAISLLFVNPLAAQRPLNTDSLEALLRTLPDTTKKYTHILHSLVTIYQKKDPSLAQQRAQQLADLGQRLQRPIIYADGLSLLATLAKDRGNFEQCIRYNLAALRIYEQEKSQRGICIVSNYLGVLYKQMGQPRKALPYYQQVVRIAREQVQTLGPEHKLYRPFATMLAFGLSNVGTTYFAIGDYTRALPLYEAALAQARKVENPDAIATALTNLGEVSIKQKQYAKALGYFKESLMLDEAAENEVGQAESWLVIGQAQHALGRQPEARAALEKSVALARKMELPLILKEAYAELAEVYEKTGQYQQALSYRRQYQALSDTLYTQESTKQVAEMQTKYETEKKEAQNRLLTKQQQLQAAQLRTQQQIIRRRNTQLIAGVAVVGLLGLLAYLLYTRRQLRQRIELEQERQRLTRLRSEAVLQAEEAERRRIGSDLHDGVGQLLTVAKLNLSALSAQLGVQTQGQQTLIDNALSVVDESFREVRSISHNLMPNALIKRGLAQAVRDFLDKITPDGRLRIHLEVVGLDRERLDPTMENVLFRVIQELVQNIIKHAQATEVTLQLIRHETELTVLVEDNGVGFDPATLGDDNGIGLRNIESRLAYLGGRADFDAAPGRGTTVTLEVPLRREAA